jgi:hypothetical protein
VDEHRLISTEYDTNAIESSANSIKSSATIATTTSNPHISTEVTEQSEACENVGLDTSMFNGDNVEILSPFFSSIFDDNGKLIECDQQLLNHFGKY